ncbi:hypothetical protein PQX77_018328 [Marasmius sp. AFHP31]|nr:hypothetical protein PQX77_018328 [Marasmius sp. AFHP31]
MNVGFLTSPTSDFAPPHYLRSLHQRRHNVFTSPHPPGESRFLHPLPPSSQPSPASPSPPLPLSPSPPLPLFSSSSQHSVFHNRHPSIRQASKATQPNIAESPVCLASLDALIMNTGIQNYQRGSGPQNNNNAGGTQSVSFVNSFNTTVDAPLRLKSLWDAIMGVGASHNAEQQYARGECLPGTREEVIRIILEWILSNGTEFPICWLAGTAGVGKTAIAITIAKECEQRSHLASSFFFFRSDPRRNNPSALILTIAHGLVVTNSAHRVFINQRISDNPTILEAQMEEQFRELVVKPHAHQTPLPLQTPLSSQAPLPLQKPQKPSLRQKWSGRISRFLGKHSRAKKMDPDQQSNANQPEVSNQPEVPDQPEIPNLVIMDGLDECGDEQTQKRVLSRIQFTFRDSPHFPLRFLICSRPEAWLKEAFTANRLSRLSKSILLNDDFRPAEDIMRYYRHQFREIVSDPKYDQVQFPDPWPTEEELETLVNKSCSQFVYATTVYRFIAHADNDPMDQLHLVLKSTSNSQPGASPYQELDALYNTILSANPNHDKVRPILAVIIALSDLEIPSMRRTLSGSGRLELSPILIELLLGLPSGQVALRLRGMHSVLNIGGRDKAITVHHTSFREYLLDRARSGHFHIDIDTQKYVIARQWLQNLTTSKVRKYSSGQLYSNGTWTFFMGWTSLCTSIPKPSRDLLDDLWNFNLASTSARIRYNDWDGIFKVLIQWVKKYDSPRIHQTIDKQKAAETHSKVGKNARLKPDSHPSCDNGQSEVEAHNREMAKEEEGLDLVEHLVHKFENRPGCFHLVCPPGVPPRKDVVNYIVGRAVGCSFMLKQVESEPSDVDDVQLTGCCCDLSGGSESTDPGHLAYREACRQLVKAYVSRFEELAQSSAEDDNTFTILGWYFLNMVYSSLLKHCCLDQELLLLCRTFFGLAEGCLKMQINSRVGKAGRQNMLRWIETFPDEFAEEGKALKAQVRALPWKQWAQNYHSEYRSGHTFKWDSDDSDNPHEL